MRRRLVRRRLLGLWLGVCGLGLVLAVVAVGYLPSDLRTYHLVGELRASGSTVRATDVRVRYGHDGLSRGSAVTSVVVDVTDPRTGEPATLRLRGIEDTGTYERDGWQPPAADSPYRPPLDVVVPRGPGRFAMAAPDVIDPGPNPWWENGLIVLGGAAPAVLTAAALLLARRRRLRGP